VKKTFQIAFKDLRITFRDPVGMILMLIAPLALTLVISAAFGGSGSGGSSIGLIPIAVINRDTGQFGPYILEAFQSDQVSELVEVKDFPSEEAARLAVDHDELASVVIIPENFSASLIPQNSGFGSGILQTQTSQVTLYNNPSRSISTSIVRAIVDTVVGQFITGSAAGQVAIEKLITSGRMDVSQAITSGESIGRAVGEESLTDSLIDLQVSTYTPEGKLQEDFSWLKYSAASMAILYLTFTLTSSGRSILRERESGTLTRILTAPLSSAELLGGKLIAGVATGLFQMGVLIISSSLLFQMNWGDPLAVTLATLALVLAATGWGLIPAAFSCSSGQAASAGTAIVLIFAALAGNFVPRMAMPEILQKISLITPNAWGIETYYALVNGSGLADILPAIWALLGMAAITFAISILMFRRQLQ
jgi:ABC-2 type transport system permease protein